MENVQGPTDQPSPDKAYSHQYKHAMGLFEDALHEYHKASPDKTHQKEEFVEVMNKTIHVMDEIASQVIKSKLQKEKESKLEDDFHKFLNDHKNKNQKELAKDHQALAQDVNELRSSLHNK